MDEIKTNEVVNNLAAPEQSILLNPEPSFWRKNRWALYVIAFSLVAIGAVVLWRSFTNRAVTKPKVTVSIEAPAQLPSGSEVIYRIKFANNDKDTIKNLRMDLIYPQGFVYEDSVPKTSKINGEEFNLPNLDPSQDATLMIKGILNGNVNEGKNITAVLHYNFESFNSEFVTQAQATTTISNSNVVMQFDGPLSMNNDEEVTYTLSYSNLTDAAIKNAHLKITLPGAFKVTEYSKQTPTPNNFDLGTLDAQTQSKITIKGKFSGADVGQKQDFSAELDGNTSDGNQVSLANATYLVEITAVPLSATLDVSNQSSGDASNAGSVDPGNTLSYKVHYKNNNSSAETGVTIKVVLDGGVFDPATIQATGADVRNNIITWNASQVDALQNLSPGQTGDLSFQAQILNPATRANVKNLLATATTQISSKEHPQGFSGAPLSLKVSTLIQLTGAVVHSNGPLPPLVGQNTTYLLIFTVKNSSNDVDNAIATMNLPFAVNFDKSTINANEAQNVTYDTTTKKLTWNLGKLLAHTGDYNAARKLQFNVTINPGLSNLNSEMTLARNIQLNGTDDFTTNKVFVTIQDLTTYNEPSGNGQVNQ